MYMGASTRPARTTPKARLARTPVTNHGSLMELGMDRLQCDCATSVHPALQPRDGPSPCRPGLVLRAREFFPLCAPLHLFPFPRMFDWLRLVQSLDELP